ncbi:MAG: hypothetical protein K6A23_06975 [Butyrivibrio sp.]|nr:hypothetical protein [Butyrivibrio sp.]
MGKDNTTEVISKVNEKLNLFKTLKEAGFRTELDSGSVPTVICKTVEDMDRTIKEVKKLVKLNGYNSSFGVRVMRRGDINLLDDNEENGDKSVEDAATVEFSEEDEIQQAV